MKKVIVVVGPTAVGKSKIGIMLAKKLNTEIISGDSVQIYKELNIGSAKVTEKEMEGVKHHLIDVLPLGEPYSVCDFQRMARKIMNELPIPIIVGGTGLYISAVLSNYEFNAPKRDLDFSKKYQSLSNLELYDLLKEKDFESSIKIHPNNRNRVLRALEATIDNCPLSNSCKKQELLYDPYIVFLTSDREILYNRINNRVDEMFSEGLVEEVKRNKEAGFIPKAIGYQEFIPYFSNECSLEEVKETIKKNTRHLAKRQITWFKNQMKAHFYDVNFNNLNETFNNIYHDVIDFLERR